MRAKELSEDSSFLHTRRDFAADQTAKVVRRRLADKEEISNLDDELHIQPSQIHLWVKEVLELAERAFERSTGQAAKRADDAKVLRIQQLEEKLCKKKGQRETAECILLRYDALRPGRRVGHC